MILVYNLLLVGGKCMLFRSQGITLSIGFTTVRSYKIEICIELRVH